MNNALRPAPRSKPIRSLFLILLGSLISALGVWWIARAIDPERLTTTFQAVETQWLLIAVVAVVATIFTRTWRWAILLRPLVFAPSLTATALLTGQIMNFVLPIRLGDIVRSIWLGRAPHSSFARVFGSVVIEKGWDWLTLCLMVILLAWFAPLPAWFIVPARIVGFVAAIALLAFSFVALLPELALRQTLVKLERGMAWLPVSLRVILIPAALRLADSLIALRRREAIIGAAAWSAATWSLGTAANYSVMRAYGVDAWSAALLLLVVLMVGVALPPSIAAIGVFEGLTILTLSAFSIPIESALAIGLTLHLVILAPPLIVLGLLFVWRALRTLVVPPIKSQSKGE